MHGLLKKCTLSVMMLVAVGQMNAAQNAPKANGWQVATLLARLGAASATAGATTIAFKQSSPDVSWVATGSALVVSSILAARFVCGRDINRHGVTVPVIGRELPAEFNWFNLIVGSAAAAIYGLYYNSDKLVAAYNLLANSVSK